MSVLAARDSSIVRRFLGNEYPISISADLDLLQPRDDRRIVV